MTQECQGSDVPGRPSKQGQAARCPICTDGRDIVLTDEPDQKARDLQPACAEEDRACLGVTIVEHIELIGRELGGPFVISAVQGYDSDIMFGRDGKEGLECLWGRTERADLSQSVQMSTYGRCT